MQRRSEPLSPDRLHCTQSQAHLITMGERVKDMVTGLTEETRELTKGRYAGISSRTHSCSHCGTTFVGRLNQKYCSDKCRWAGRRKRDGIPQEALTVDEPANCAHCGGAFMRSNRRRIYCCDSCRVLASRLKSTRAVQMVADLNSVPVDKILDVRDMGGAALINKYLQSIGLSYDIQSQSWL
jgi:hypothetical protein